MMCAKRGVDAPLVNNRWNNDNPENVQVRYQPCPNGDGGNPRTDVSLQRESEPWVTSARHRPNYDSTKVRFAYFGLYPGNAPDKRNASRGALPRVQLDDQLFVHDGLHLFPGRDARDFAAERVAIGCQPVGHGDNLCEIKISQDQLA